MSAEASNVAAMFILNNDAKLKKNRKLKNG